MNSLPSEGTAELPTDRRRKACSRCGKSNPPWASDCLGCRRPFADAREAASAEIKHIDYVLQQLPLWLEGKHLSGSAYLRLHSECLKRQKELTAFLVPSQGNGQQREEQTDNPAPLYNASAKVNASAPVWNWYGQARQPEPAGTSAVVRPLDLPPPPRSTEAGGLRLFFQKHALQIVFALASVLVLAALRTILGWTWIGDVAMRLLPALPLGLTAMFWTFGQKTRAENPWAAFVYHGLAAALSAFDVIALNRYWLPVPLEARPVLLLSALAAAAVAGVLFRRQREIAYLHLLQAATLTTLFATLQMLRFQAPPEDFRLTPLWLFGAAFLSYAAFCLVMARRSEAAGQVWRDAWTFWAHLSVVGVLFLAAIHLALERPDMNEFALLSLLTGLVYGSGAQLLRDARMVRIAGLFLLGSGLLRVGEQPRELWSEHAGAFLLACSGIAIVLARYNRRQAGERGAGERLAKAYLEIGRWYVSLATLLSAVTLLYAFIAADAPLDPVHGGVRCLLTLACGGFYLVFARLEDRAFLLYAAFATWPVGLVSLLHAEAAPHGLYPLTVTLYGGALALLADRQSPNAGAAHAAGQDWVEPLRKSGMALITVGALLAAGLPFQDTLAASWLWTTATLALALPLYALHARRSGEAGSAYAALLCTAGINAMLTWRALAPQPFRLADSLAAFLLAASAASLVLARHAGTLNAEKALWHRCVTHVALAAALFCLSDGVYAFCIAPHASHAALSLLPCLVSGLLLCRTRYVRPEGADDGIRQAALACAGISAGVEIGLLCHGLYSVGAGWPPAALRAWGIGLVALGWVWMAAARTSRNWTEQAWWRNELTLAALLTAFAGLLLLLQAPATPLSGGELALFETAFAAAFALFILPALEADRALQAVLIVPSLLVAGMAAFANRAYGPTGVTLTFAAYGIAYTLLAGRSRAAAFVAPAALALSATYIHHLLSLTALYGAVPALSWPRFAFYAVQAALLWALLGRQVRRRLAHRPDLALPLLALAGAIALASGSVALLTVQTPGEGRWSVLTLGGAGIVWFLLWMLDQGEICLHVATWNLLAAWSLVVYDRSGASAAVLDLHLLPVGLYLVTIGHLQSRRQRQQEARSLWTAGLLLTITPAFLAYWNRVGDMHTLLFVGECLLAVLWGIHQRIRAFVLVGTGFIGLYAASVIVGRLPGIWGTLVTLVIGITLFTLGFYILTHRARMQQWAAAMERQWEAWQAWR